MCVATMATGMGLFYVLKKYLLYCRASGLALSGLDACLFMYIMQVDVRLSMYNPCLMLSSCFFFFIGTLGICVCVCVCVEDQGKTRGHDLGQKM